MMIKCDNLSKSYGSEKTPALNQLSIEVEKNSIFGFLGPNGAGKTTTIKILTGLMSQTSGSAYIAGELVGINSLSLRRKIGYLGQEPKMYSWMKGKELLMFVGEIFDLTKQQRSSRADELLEMAGLTSAANKKISSYSGGMLQRLGVAQAMVGKPEVLLLDEPTSALDPIGRKEVLDFILSLKETCTVFMSTHILTDVERVCDTVAIINQGKLITQDKTDVLKKKFAQKIINVELSDIMQIEDFKTDLISIGFGDIIKVDNNIVSIHSNNILKDKNKILEFIISKKIEIDKFELVNASLEDVFVKLIGGEHE
jgi:ABC-2 type transport system ATP-binding protein